MKKKHKNPQFPIGKRKYKITNFSENTKIPNIKWKEKTQNPKFQNIENPQYPTGKGNIYNRRIPNILISPISKRKRNKYNTIMLQKIPILIMIFLFSFKNDIRGQWLKQTGGMS
jgi:hypothetical protein